jgi:prevent-host-death family protein
MKSSPAAERVGIRDLKAHLSRHLRRVQGGARIMVTDRGRSIATIVPIEPSPDLGWTQQLVAEGRARWDGGKPAGCSRPVEVASERTVSAAVLEDRR